MVLAAHHRGDGSRGGIDEGQSLLGTFADNLSGFSGTTHKYGTAVFRRHGQRHVLKG